MFAPGGTAGSVGQSGKAANLLLVRTPRVQNGCHKTARDLGGPVEMTCTMEFDCNLMSGQNTDCPNLSECQRLNSQRDWRLRHNRIEAIQQETAAIQQETARKLDEIELMQAQWTLEPQHRTEESRRRQSELQAELVAKLAEMKAIRQKRDAEKRAQREQIYQRLERTDERLDEISVNLEKLQSKFDAYQRLTTKMVRLAYVVMGLAVISVLWQFLSSAG